MSESWLTDDEVAELTRRVQPAAQMRALRNARPPITFTVVDGRPVVPRSQIEQNPTSYEPQLRLVK